MSKSAHALVLFSAAVAALAAAPAARAAVISQSASIPFTTTNFGPGTGSVPPLSFQQFDTQSGSRVLDSVTLSMNASVRSDFNMVFTNPATITDSIMSNTPGSPGPSITIYQPDGTHSLVTANSPSDPSSLTRSVTYGFQPGQTTTTPQVFSSTFNSTSPYYLAPAITQASNTLTLTSPSDLALFTGSGSLTLPVAATANSTFTSSSGNGYGGIFTHGTASVTVTYNYHNQVPAPETVPEPAAALLWGIGGLTLLAARRAVAKR